MAKPAQEERSRARTGVSNGKAPAAECCVLCGGIIQRFDREIFLVHQRCAPCHETLTDE